MKEYKVASLCYLAACIAFFLAAVATIFYNEGLGIFDLVLSAIFMCLFKVYYDKYIGKLKSKEELQKEKKL